MQVILDASGSNQAAILDYLAYAAITLTETSSGVNVDGYVNQPISLTLKNNEPAEAAGIRFTFIGFEQPINFGASVDSSQIENTGYTSSFKQDKQTVYKSFTPQPVTSSSNYGATVTTEASDSYGASLNGS